MADEESRRGDEYVSLAYHGLRAQDTSFKITIVRNYDPSVGRVNLVSQDIVRRVESDVRRHARSVPPSNDVTGMASRYHGQCRSNYFGPTFASPRAAT
ncbi:MAG: hypothetical protein ABSA59_11900 [Terriglobia bacterium]|jgi:hypothetical protein